MVETLPTLPLWVDVTAMSTTAIYGAATARGRNVPVAGTLFAGILGGAAGGIVRDLLLGLDRGGQLRWKWQYGVERRVYD